MAKLDGQGTQVTKLGVEHYASYNFDPIKDVGKFVFSEAGSGTYTADPDFTHDTVVGNDFVIRASNPIKSTSDIGVTINGTKPGGGAIVGNATIKKNVPEGQSYSVVVSGSFKFASITSVACSNGLFGDGFEVLVLPAEANDVPIKYLEGINPSEGTTVKPVYDHYDKDHDKRIRGENRLTLTALYIKNDEGLSRIKNRDVVLRIDTKDDGQPGITEVVYYDKCRLGVSVETPSAPDDHIRDRAEGSFGRRLAFS